MVELAQILQVTEHGRSVHVVRERTLLQLNFPHLALALSDPTETEPLLVDFAC